MTNYHTHTYRCRHATGEVQDYVEEARKAGLRELGFSDHVPQPDGRWADCRMDIGELSGYVAAVERAREAEARRPGGGISIRLGLECEWSPELESYYREELLGRHGIEYLVGGIHNYVLDGRWRDSFCIESPRGLAAYARQVEGALNCGLFAFLAHPDVFCNGYLPWDAEAKACAHDVLAACASVGMPIEVNGNGLRKPMVRAPEGRRPPYPHREFWDLAKDYGLKALACSDAHRPIDVGRGLLEGKDLATSCGLEVLGSLPLPIRA